MKNPLSSYGRHFIEEDDLDAVRSALMGDFLTGGARVEQFEKDLTLVTRSRHALTCANGTAGLHMACHALGVTRGTTAIVPSITFLATANAAIMMGADVVFADVDPSTALMEPHHFEEALKRCPSKPVVVLPVHIGGQVCDMKRISNIARAHDIKIIEDACHALGTQYYDGEKTRYVGDGTYSDATMLSFHPVKNITTGEGGAITTQDDQVMDRLRTLRSHGMVRDPGRFLNRDMGFTAGEPNPWYYEMPDYGYNYRLTDIQAALGISQLKKLCRFKAHREKIRSAYERHLAPFAPHIRPVPRVPGCDPLWHLMTVLIDFDARDISRAQVMKALSTREIGTQVHYIPVHQQPFYHKNFPQPFLPGADTYYRQTLTLPLHVHIEEIHVEQAVQTLASVLSL